MTTYYEKLKQSIKDNNIKLERLYLERRALAQSHRAWSVENYNIENPRINDSIDKIEKTLNEEKELLSTIDLINSYREDIDKLAKIYNKEEDLSLKNQISEEILLRSDFITRKLNYSLDENLSKEIIASPVVEDKKINELLEQRSTLEQQVREVEEKIAESIIKIRDIFTNEKEERNSKGLFETEEDLDKFNLDYMNQKISENKILEENKKVAHRLRKQIDIIDKNINMRRTIVKEAKKININPDDYESIINRTNRRAELNKFLNDLGLTELANKGNSLFVQSSEEVEKNKKIVQDKLLASKVEQAKRSIKKPLPNNKEIKEVVAKEEQLSVESLQKIIDRKLHDLEEITKRPMKDIPKQIMKEIPKKPIHESIELPKPEYGYKTVLAKLVKDLPTIKSNKPYRATNLTISQKFKNELHLGKVLYNVIHIVPRVIKLPFQLFQKAKERIISQKIVKQRLNIVKNRLDHLPDKDLMILFKEYGNHAKEEKLGSSINKLIKDRVVRFANEKVTKLNKNIVTKYQELYNCMREIDTIDYILRNNDLAPKQKEQYLKYRTKALKGKALEVAKVRSDYETAKTLVSSGIQALNKGTRTLEIPFITRRLTKERNLDIDLLEKEARYERAEKKSIQEGNDEMALRIFIATECLLNRSSKKDRKIIGKSKKKYKPLVESINNISNIPTLINTIKTNKKRGKYQKDIVNIVDDYQNYQEVLTTEIESNRKR